MLARKLAYRKDKPSAASVMEVEGMSAPSSTPIVPGREATVTLREVTAETVRPICRLLVAEHQKHVVAPNSVSIAEAYFHRDNAWFRAIYAGEEPVGFVMIYDNPEKAEYFLWRYMIDARYQGRGFGRRALELIIEHVKTRPGAKELSVSFHRVPGGPEGFYRWMGFVETGEMNGEEHLAKLVLEP